MLVILFFYYLHIYNTLEKFEIRYNISEEEETALYKQDQIWLGLAKNEGRLEWLERRSAEHRFDVPASKVRILKKKLFPMIPLKFYPLRNHHFPKK